MINELSYLQYYLRDILSEQMKERPFDPKWKRNEAAAIIGGVKEWAEDNGVEIEPPSFADMEPAILYAFAHTDYVNRIVTYASNLAMFGDDGTLMDAVKADDPEVRWRLYFWDDVLSSWSSGSAVAVAQSEDEARFLLDKATDGSSLDGSDGFTESPQIRELDEPFAFAQYGSG